MVKRDWPHHVLTLTPPNGFGDGLNAIYAHLSGHDFGAASAYGPGKPDGCYWCFRSDADAVAFKAWYEGTFPDNPPPSCPFYQAPKRLF